jgi:hypothetical protein
MPLTSVGGGLRNAGWLLARFGSCGPGSLSAFGLTTLTAPSAGSSGLPKDAASAADAAATAAPGGARGEQAAAGKGDIFLHESLLI